MTSPRVVFSDPLVVVPVILRNELPALWGATVKVGTLDPEARKSTNQGLPYVRVFNDAQVGRYPVTQNAALRVAVYAKNEADSLRLAQLCKAILLSFPGSAVVRSFASTSGPNPATDPDSGAPFAFFPATARLCPLPL